MSVIALLYAIPCVLVYVKTVSKSFSSNKAFVQNNYRYSIADCHARCLLSMPLVWVCSKFYLTIFDEHSLYVIAIVAPAQVPVVLVVNNASIVRW